MQRYVHIPTAKIIELYKRLRSMHKVAEQLKISVHAVSRRLKKAGFVLQRNCPHCGATVTGAPQKVYCSQAHREAARPFRDAVQHDPKPCAHCGTDFTPKRSDQIYCSHNCNVAAYLERGEHKSERRAYMRKRYNRNRLPMLEKQKQLRALDPDGWNRRYREWLHQNPQRMKDYSLRNSERVKALRKTVRDLKEGKVGPDRIIVRKGGPPTQDARAARVDELYTQGMRWPAIRQQIEKEFQVHTTEKALSQLRTRYLERKGKST